MPAWISNVVTALAIKMRRGAQQVHANSLRSTIAAAREESDGRNRDALYVQSHLGENDEVVRKLRDEANNATRRLTALEKKSAGS